MLRCPPSHCELNPIEMFWSMVNKNVKKKTARHWNNLIRHVIEEEQKFWEIDNIVDSIINEMAIIIINWTAESDSEINNTV